jgi:phage terminase large subunit-like protein
MTPFWKPKIGKVKEASRWQRTGAHFDRAKADRAVDFIETCCRHVKGELAGQPFKIEGWQREIVRGIFGWARPNGTRLYREVYIEVPRKNGKSSMGAALALYLLFADGEQGAEIYSAAADTDQAAIVFGVAKGMVEQDPDLSSVSEAFRRTIVYKSNAYNVLSADAPTKHGKNSHGILFDELHAQPNRELYDVLKTSTGSRRSPLLIMFTTAGFDRHSICWEVHEYAQKVIDGTVNDPAFLPIIFCAGETDDWTSPKIWKKANPNLGVSIKEDYLAAECEKAKVTPAYENTFKRLHLNIWTQQDVRWLQMTEWDACAAPPVNYDELRGRRCFGGLDLASTTDIAALALIFPPKTENDRFIVLPFFWIPEESMHARVLRDRVPYDVWQREGFLEATPGNSIDYRYIMLRLGRCRVDFDFKALAFDRWGSTQITTTLCDEYGFTSDEKEAANFRKPMLWQFGQGFSSMTGPTKELLNYILARKITHGGNPVLRWMANNVVVKQDPAGNIKPDKGKSIEKIDGIVSTIMALELAIRHGNEKGSIYNDREMRFL